MSYTLVGTNSKEWDSANETLADIYYSCHYYKLNRHLHKGDPKCFIFSRDGHTSYYPFFLSKIPGTDLYDIEGAYGYNGVSSAIADPEYRKAFFSAFSDFCQESNIIAEFTRFHPLLENHKFSEYSMDVSFNRNTVYLNLDQGYNDVWEKEYAVRTRNSIRKAQKLGVNVTEENSPEAYAEFFSLYSETMKSVNADAFYQWPLEYFKELFEWGNNRRRLLFAYHNGEMIAGAMFLLHRPFIHYHLSARRMIHADIPSGQLLLDHAINMGIQEAYLKMHFGGGATTAADDGLLRFKQGFSKSMAEFYIGKRIHNNEQYQRLIRQWDEAHPGKASEMQGHFLRYRLR